VQLLLEQSQKHSVLLFHTWARHYAQVIDAENAGPVQAQDSGLIREIMVTLDDRFVDEALVERARSGEAGWSTAEILRAQADRLVALDRDSLPDPHRWQASSHRVLKCAEDLGSTANHCGSLLASSHRIVRCSEDLDSTANHCGSLLASSHRIVRCSEDLDSTANHCGSWLASDGVSSASDNLETAEKILQQALSIAQSQGALAWELRTTTSLAQLWQRQHRYREALDLLTPIYQRFTEGYATPDLRTVRRLLDELNRQLKL
jgi:hypothetical protein